MYFRKLFITALLFFAFQFLLADNKKIDSLETLLSNAQSDHERIALFNSLSKAHANISPAISNRYAQMAYALAKKNNDSTALAFSLYALGDSYRSLTAFDKSLMYLLEALKLYEKLNDKKLELQCANSIGIVFASIGNLGKAIEYFSRCLSLGEDLNDTSIMAPVLTNLGLLSHQDKQYDKSISYYNRALEIAMATHNEFGISLIYINLGMALCEKGEYLKGLDYFLKAKELHERQQNMEGVAIAIISMGNVYSYYLNQQEKAISLYEEGITMAKELGNKRVLKNTYTALSDAYMKINDYERAYNTFKLLVEVKDSILNEESSKQISEMQTKYESEKKEKEIQILKKDQEIQKSEVARQKLMRNSFIGASSLALLLALLLFNRYQIKRRANVRLAEQNEKILLQKSVIEEQKQNITDSIEYASNIQRAMLPTSDEFIRLFPESFILYKPRDIVSGDFYWIAQVNSPSEKGDRGIGQDLINPPSPPFSKGEIPAFTQVQQFMLACCDCTGHGVPGAFMSMLCTALLNEAVNDKGLTKPNEIFEDVRKGIIAALKQRGQMGGSKDGMDATIISINDKYLHATCANNPVYIVSNGNLIEIPPDRFPVGVYESEQKPFTLHETELNKGDMVYTVTDGFEDQLGGEKGKKFKSKNLKELLVSLADKPIEQQKQILEKTFESWEGNGEQTDDVTIIGIRV